MSNYSRDPHPRTGALRAQLGSIFHGHSRAEFHVQLIIHELSSVPLLDGDFGVKWKFRGVMNPKGLNSPRKGKEKEKDRPPRYYFTSPATESELDRAHAGSSRSGGVLLNSPLSTSPTHSTVSLPSTASSSGPSHAAGSSSCHSYPSNFVESEPGSPSLKATHFHGHDRGITPFLPLCDHKIVFEHTVDVLLQMYIDNSYVPSETQNPPPVRTGSWKTNPKGKLLPSPLKLVITQKVIPNDPDSPTQPRLGAIYLDLAEYADPTLGPVTRKYLLAESRTNAILKLTIHITAHSVPANGFIAPTLRPPTIQSSLSNLLKTRPKFDSRASTPITSSYPKPASPMPFLDDLHRTIPNLHSKTVETRDIIEAIFNPVPTSNPTPSPFTYYVAPPASSPPNPTKNLPEVIPRYAHSDGGGADRTVILGRPAPKRAVSIRSKSSLSNELVLGDDQTSLIDATIRLSPRVILTELNEQSRETAIPRVSPPRPTRSPAQASFSSQESDMVVEVGKDKHWWKRLRHGHVHTTPSRNKSPPSR